MQRSQVEAKQRDTREMLGEEQKRGVLVNENKRYEKAARVRSEEIQLPVGSLLLLAVIFVGRPPVIDFDLGHDRIYGVAVNGTGNLQSWSARI